MRSRPGDEQVRAAPHLHPGTSERRLVFRNGAGRCSVPAALDGDDLARGMRRDPGLQFGCLEDFDRRAQAPGEVVLRVVLAEVRQRHLRLLQRGEMARRGPRIAVRNECGNHPGADHRERGEHGESESARLCLYCFFIKNQKKR